MEHVAFLYLSCGSEPYKFRYDISSVFHDSANILWRTYLKISTIQYHLRGYNFGGLGCREVGCNFGKKRNI